MYTRRDFGKLAAATLPLAKAFGGVDSKIDGVQLGVQSYSFRDLSFDDALKAMVADGLGACELFAQHIEEGKTSVPPMAGRPQSGGAPPLDLAARAAKREALRQWRLSVPMDYYKGIRKRFDQAGINLYAYNISFREDFTDPEIDRSFDAAKNLGVKFITASTTVPTAKRLIPFVSKHRMVVAMHGHSNLKDPNEFAKPESFAQAVDMSQWFKVNLDIGHFTAAGYDPVEYIKQHHDEIVLLHLKDRKKDNGPNVPWGEGDTRIKDVLLLLKDQKYPIPAFIEYEYKGAASSPEEVKKCFAYCKHVLNSQSS